eukprot:TRINITY_DN5297_c0_g1_i3.p1 TRINITY_DN5297_c0_g1~~TRINITY_DN5297_c0_g1_i3.p1  ORF type:complete len:609 (+),score=59.03 TRINITY_DN5297_c0_g1_i3:263-2089(+)
MDLDIISNFGRQLLQEEENKSSEQLTSLAVFMFLGLLLLAFTLGHFLDKRNISWFSEAGGALLIGLVIGLFIFGVARDSDFAHNLQFKVELFFIALLPPIIFEAGFSLRGKPFFRNIGAVCMYAFVGTTVSTFAIGLTMWAFGAWGVVYKTEFVESLLFGAIISATDPVTVLSVFAKLGANDHLYTLVFGESVMNDAVAIVLYKTILTFVGHEFEAGKFFWGVGYFLLVFIGSMLIGVLSGLFFTILLRTKWFISEHVPLEACLVLISAFLSYYLAEGLTLSGIVAILFNGIVAAKYMRRNLSEETAEYLPQLLKVLAYLSETFVFIYIGITLFLDDQSWSNGLTWSFLIISFFALAWSRFVNIVPNTYIINKWRVSEKQIPWQFQVMMWWSGLRGAIAFALALRSKEDLEEDRAETANVFKTTTFFLVLITVLINGGACSYLMNVFGLGKTGYVSLEMSQKAKLANQSREQRKKKAGSYQGFIARTVLSFDNVLFGLVVRDAENQERTVLEDEPTIPFNTGETTTLASHVLNQGVSSEIELAKVSDQEDEDIESNAHKQVNLHHRQTYNDNNNNNNHSNNNNNNDDDVNAGGNVSGAPKSISIKPIV